MAFTSKSLSKMLLILFRLEPILTPYLSELQGLNAHECNQQTKAKTIFHLKLVTSMTIAITLLQCRVFLNHEIAYQIMNFLSLTLFVCFENDVQMFN